MIFIFIDIPRHRVGFETIIKTFEALSHTDRREPISREGRSRFAEKTYIGA